MAAVLFLVMACALGLGGPLVLSVYDGKASGAWIVVIDVVDAMCACMFGCCDLNDGVLPCLTCRRRLWAMMESMNLL